MNRRTFFSSMAVGAAIAVVPGVVAAKIHSTSNLLVNRYWVPPTQAAGSYTVSWWTPIELEDLRTGMEVVGRNHPGRRMLVRRGARNGRARGVCLTEYTGPAVPWLSKNPWAPRSRRAKA